MLSFKGQRRLRDLLFETMILEQKAEYLREDLCRVHIFEPYAAFQRIANDPNKKYIYVEDIQRFLHQNRFNQPYESCLMLIKQYESFKNSFHLSYIEFLECVFPIMNVRLREEVAQRDKQEFQELLAFDVENTLSQLINYEVSYLQKLDRLKGELRDSDQNFSPVNCFKAIDLQTLGFIDDDAIRNFMVKNGTVLTENQAYFIVRRINKNKTGKITLEEFSQYIVMQYSSQFDKNIERTRAKSLNTNQSYLEYDYTDFYLQKYNYLSNKKTDTSLHFSRKNLSGSQNELQIQDPINNEDYVQQLNSSYYNKRSQSSKKSQKEEAQFDRYAQTSIKKQNKFNENQAVEQQEQLEDNQGSKKFCQSAQRFNESNGNKITFGIEQKFSNSSNNNLFYNYSNKFAKTYAKYPSQNEFNSNHNSLKKIMMESTAQSFYMPNTQNQFFRNSTLSHQNQLDINGSSYKGLSVYPPVAEAQEEKYKKDFVVFLQDLVLISQLDRSVENAKLEFLGLINFSISNLFELIDKFQRNNIVYQELKDFINLELNFKSFTTVECQIIFQYFDIHSRGFISKEDIIQKFTPLNPFLINGKPYIKINLLSEAEKQKLKFYFQQIVSSHVKITEIKQIYTTRNNNNYNSLSLNELFNKLDRDNDSFISIYDFKIKLEEEKIEAHSNEELNFFKQIYPKPFNQYTKSSQPQEKLQNIHSANRILQTQNQNFDDSQQNYSNDILEQQDDTCEPLNCKFNCCDKNGACPDKQSDCYFYKCENFMCLDGGCCIKGVCRPNKDCKNSKIFRYISIGILVATFLVLQLFKQKIEKFFSERQWYSCIQNKDQNQKSLSDNIAEKTTQNQVQTENRSSNILNTHKKNKNTLAAFNYLEKNNNHNIFYPQGQRSIFQNSNEDNCSNTIFSDNKKDNLVFKNTDVIVDQFCQSPPQNRIAQLKENHPSQLSSSFNINKFPVGISELQNQQSKNN
ncbi:hypothetical protein ABPG72_017624 [Tetrahymena utriculariae]